MAPKKDKKPKYTGPRSLFDTVGEREVIAKRRERLEKNRNSALSNGAFALDNPEFKAACEKVALKQLGIENKDDLTPDGLEVLQNRTQALATPRQASKFRQPGAYGLAARAAGKNARKDPRA